MAADGCADAAREVLARADTPGNAPVGEAFCAARRLLETHYRCEYVYKAAIVDRVVFGRHRPTTAGVQPELMVGRSIVDLAVFNGTSTAYEIKTELDTDRRLNTQTSDYLSAFDKIFVVTHPDLAGSYEAVVDERVGVLSLSARGQLRVVREACSDMTRVKTDVLFRMLRQDEYIDIVEQHFGPQGALPSGLAFAHCEALFARLNTGTAHRGFVDAMRRRTTGPETVSLAGKLPPSLRLFGLSMRFSGKQRERLLSAMSA
jgi:hypothetical protein